MGVVLVGMWRFLKERDYIHDLEVRRHHKYIEAFLMREMARFMPGFFVGKWIQLTELLLYPLINLRRFCASWRPVLSRCITKC